MPGYLFDTNHFSEWVRGNPTLLERIAKRPVENIIWLCPIILGEIEFGLNVAATKDVQKQKECREFINAQAMHIFQQMDVETGRQYGYVLGQIYKSYPKTEADQSTQKHLTTIRVDINDVWLAAVALTHNLILVTDDEMKVIRECVPELRVENWLL